MRGVPNTNLHKLVGFVAGVLAAYLSRKFGLVLDPEWLASIMLGVSLFVGSVVAKYTNPTGANESTTRQALEQCAEVKVRETAERKAPTYHTSKLPDIEGE